MCCFFGLSRPLFRVLAVSALLTVLAGCQHLPFSIPFLGDRSDPQKSQLNQEKPAGGLRRIYIQNFSGQKIKEVQAVFFNAVQEQSRFTFMELLPEDLSGLGVLRIDVTDYQIWELDETVEDINRYPSLSIEAGDPIKRRNAIVSMKVSLFDAETGKRLVSQRFAQPFQQIYVGKQAIENRPGTAIELERLTKMLVFKMLDSFLTADEKIVPLQYEKGAGHDWFSRKIYDFGNRRIEKGIRYAESGELDDAIWIWRIFLFAPDKDQPQDIYLQNRAAAYYNLGIAYQQKQDWWQAAEMFSAANRIKQKLKYAQAWGNNMQTWLEEQRASKPQKQPAPIVKTAEKKVESTQEKKPPAIVNLENNSQLLLKPRILWPLDPYLKQQERQQEIGTQPRNTAQ